LSEPALTEQGLVTELRIPASRGHRDRNAAERPAARDAGQSLDDAELLPGFSAPLSTPPDIGRCMPLVNLPAEEPEKLLVSQACLAEDAHDDVLWQVKAFVIGHSNPSRLVGMFEMNVGAAGFVNVKTSFLKGTDDFSRLEVCELG